MTSGETNASWRAVAAWLTKTDAGSRAFFILLVPLAIVFYALGGLIPAGLVFGLGGFVRWQNPRGVRTLGRRRMQDLVNSLASERGRFVWVLIFWVIAYSLLDVWTAYLIALLSFIAYWTCFIDFLQEALKNEWPYNVLTGLGALMLYCFSSLSAVFSNYAILSITGFHPAQFPSSGRLLAGGFMILAVFFSFTVISGLAAVATGFSSKIAARIAPIAFMLTLPGLIILTGAIGQDQGIINFMEAIIISVDFNENARFESGSYVVADNVHAYGTKVCRNLPFNTLVASHSDGGYITAVRRTKPAVRANAEKSRVMATNFIYDFVEQKECPAIQEFFDEPSKPLPAHQSGPSPS